MYEYSAGDRKFVTNCPSGFRALLGTISRGNQSPRDFTVLFVWYLATVGLPGKGFGHNGTHRDSLLVPGKVSSHDETRRDLLCRLRTTESTGSSHDRTKRETLRGIPLPRYYTGFVCTASKHHGTLQDLSTKSFPGTGNFSILYVYQTRLIWGKVLFCEYL